MIELSDSDMLVGGGGDTLLGKCTEMVGMLVVVWQWCSDMG
jgi:hypothetical protein